MTTLIIVGIVLVIGILLAFAKSADREAKRVSLECDFRVESLDARLESIEHIIGDNDEEATRLERKAYRLKARAEEVASRQAPMWKAYSKAIRK